MLYFLRRIRKSLVAGNQVSRYLVYAIGEILLVVLGILIALQINNWNEENKRQKAEEELIGQIIEDLEADAITLESLIDRGHKKRDLATRIYDEFNGTKSFEKTYEYGDLTWQIFAPLLFKQHHQQSIEKLSDPDHRKMINEYFNQQERVTFQLNQNNDFIRLSMRPLLGNFEVMNIPMVMNYNSYDSISSRKTEFILYDKIRELKNLGEFKHLLFESKMLNIGLVYDSQILIDANKNAIAILKASLE